MGVSSEAVLEANGVSKHYGAVTALDNVDFTIRSGEIVAVVGDNGAGKSTLVKVLSGAIHPDAGEIRLEGQPVSWTGPRAARDAGIETVYQELALAPNLDVVSNIFLGREMLAPGPLALLRVLNRDEMRRRALSQLTTLQVNLPRIVGMPVRRMSGGQRQAVAIARSAFWASKVMFMDEPTAALGVRESAAVLRLARRVADHGVAIVMVSHVLSHVMEIADRVVVMRHGRKVGDMRDVKHTSEIVALIVGG